MATDKQNSIYRTIYDINHLCLDCRMFCKVSKNIDVKDCPDRKPKEKKIVEVVKE